MTAAGAKRFEGNQMNQEQALQDSASDIQMTSKAHPQTSESTFQLRNKSQQF